MAKYEPNPNFEHGKPIPHLKVMIMTRDDWEIDDDAVIYFGSHNFTASAWGRYERGDTQLTVANTELGVLFPPEAGSAELKKQIVSDLPFRYPPRKYLEGELPFFNDFFSAKSQNEVPDYKD